MHSLRNLRLESGLVLVSAGSLAFEVGLTRLFAIQQFHHFAFVVVSLAVMGIAASGLLLSLQRKHPPRALLAVGFTVAIFVSYLIINFLPFDSYSIAWDGRQTWILMLYFAASGTPFLFAGWTVGACLVEAGSKAHRPYAANLIGSALGCPTALLAMDLVGVEGTIAFAAALGLFAAAAFSTRRETQVACACVAFAGLLTAVRFPAALSLRLSPYKPLSVMLHAPDAQATLTEWSASARIDVVESDSIHVLPGLSLNAPIHPPLQAGLFIDADGPLPLNALSPDDPQATILAEHMPAMLAFKLRPEANALLVQPGAGLDILLAIAAGTQHVTVAFNEPLLFDVLTDAYADFSQQLLHHPRITPRIGSSRATLRQVDEPLDIVQFALSDAYRPISSGAFSLTENFELTVESFREAYQHLNPTGLLVVTRWLGTPPSEETRTWSILVAALQQEGVSSIADYLIAYRGMRTATLIAARRPFTVEELRLTRSFLDINGFDPIHLPDLAPGELNRYNRLPNAIYHALFTDLLENPSATIAAYDFDLKAPTDDRPFFFHFFRWRQTPEVIARLGLTWQPFGGSGYLVLLALLAVMLILALPLMTIPTLLLRRAGTEALSVRSTLFFACLGAGYLLVEIPLIQRFALLLDRPVISLAVVLFTILLASGVGSILSPRARLEYSLALLIVLLIITNTLSASLLQYALSWPLAGRVALCFLLLLPIGLLMGIPFASGLRRLQAQAPGSIPWAWAVNGAVSGLSGVLAAILSLDLGFQAALYVGTLAYLGALVSAIRR